MRLMPRVLRGSINIVVLFSALVLTPLLALSHFSVGLAGMLGNFADNYLPRPTLYSAEKKTRIKQQSELNKQRAANRKAVTKSKNVVAKRGNRILVRGAGALAVGWIPVVGVAADVASLSADFVDVCALFATIDELTALLQISEASLYSDNYCDVPEQGLEVIRESAKATHFPWDSSSPEVSQKAS